MLQRSVQVRPGLLSTSAEAVEVEALLRSVHQIDVRNADEFVVRGPGIISILVLVRPVLTQVKRICESGRFDQVLVLLKLDSVFNPDNFRDCYQEAGASGVFIVDESCSLDAVVNELAAMIELFE